MMNENISFDEDQFKIKSRSILSQSESPAMIRSLVKMGIVKSEKSANTLLLSVIVLFLLASIYVFAVFIFDVKIGGENSTLSTERVRANRDRIEQLRQQRNSSVNSNTQNNQ